MHETKRYDAIIIGAGINGTGVARDIALRGQKVLLLDKGDISAGTSWASSGMIHGGIRYLLNDVSTTKKSCKDAGYIKQIAPHLIFRIPFLFPVLRDEGLMGRINLEGADALFSIYDKFQPLKGGKSHLRLSVEDSLHIEPLLTDDIVGALAMDEWGIDVPRLCLLNALDASEHGAKIRPWTSVGEILTEKGRAYGVKCFDEITGETLRFEGDCIVNCTGPWAPKVAAMAGVHMQLRPAKGIHLILDRRISNIAVISQAIDGRQVFVIPHENTSMIGTTDDDYYGDADNIPILEDEIEYLLEAMSRTLPAIRKARIVKAIAGVRPTLFERAKYEDDLTRDHKVYDHALDSGLEGFITLAGGKLAAYRVMAEETADLVCRKLGVSVPCTTHVTPLPGGDETPDVETLANAYGLDAYQVARMVFRHGSRVKEILAMIAECPAYGVNICDCEPITEAELRYVIRHEFVRKATDLITRCRLAEGGCQGAGCTRQASLIFAEEKGLSAKEAEQEAKALLREKWRWRKNILSDVQLASEEMLFDLHQAAYASKPGDEPEEVF